MVYHRENGEWVCPKPASEDIDYYMQKGAPHCDAPVVAPNWRSQFGAHPSRLASPIGGVGAEDSGYAPVLGDNETESPLKCYKLDTEEDVVGDTVYINGEGLPEGPNKMMQMQNAVNNLRPDTLSPGVQPGDVEAILSWVVAAIIILIIVSTLIYYAFNAYSQPHGGFWTFVKNWSIKWPNWWFCPPSAQ